MWLIAKDRDAAALKSLQWLRGWVPKYVVQTEFDTIKNHKESLNSCGECKKTSTKCTHLSSQTIRQAIGQLTRKRTLKPFFILLIMTFISIFSGNLHLNSYMVQILNTYGSPMSPNWAMVG